MALVLDHARIQAALIDLAKTAGKFFKVSYDPTTGHAIVDESVAVAPKSALANEIQCLYTDAPVHKRSLQYARQLWTWELRLMFSVEVTGEAFENFCMETPPRLQWSAGVNLRTVFCKLFRSVPKHPPTQEPQTGSQIDYFFDIRLNPL